MTRQSLTSYPDSECIGIKSADDLVRVLLLHRMC